MNALTRSTVAYRHSFGPGARGNLMVWRSIDFRFGDLQVLPDLGAARRDGAVRRGFLRKEGVAAAAAGSPATETTSGGKRGRRSRIRCGWAGTRRRSWSGRARAAGRADERHPAWSGRARADRGVRRAGGRAPHGSAWALEPMSSWSQQPTQPSSRGPKWRLVTRLLGTGQTGVRLDKIGLVPRPRCRCQRGAPRAGGSDGRGMVFVYTPILVGSSSRSATGQGTTRPLLLLAG